MPKLIARWNRARDAWETETTGLFCEHSDVFSATWPSSGMTRNGVAYELPTSEHLTADSESSSLLGTPTTHPRPRSERFRAGRVPNPADLVQLLQTPSVADSLGGHWSRGGDRSGELLLGGQVRTLLPMPVADHSRGLAQPGTDYASLPNAVMDLLPTTPRATDGTKGGPNQRGSSGDLMLPSAVMLLPTPTTARAGEAKPTARHLETGGPNLPELVSLLPTPRALDSTGVRGRTPNRTDEDNARAGLTLTDVTEHLLPTPRAAADRTGRSAAVRRDSMSGPSLGQAVEIAQGILPREFTTWEELPPSWHGASTSQQYDAGND